jgi:hypothetical protein
MSIRNKKVLFRWSTAAILLCATTMIPCLAESGQPESSPSTCIKVILHTGDRILYFKEGAVERQYDRYYCVFTRFGGTAARYDSSEIRVMEDVELTQDVWDEIGRQDTSSEEAYRQTQALMQSYATGKPEAKPVEEVTPAPILLSGDPDAVAIENEPLPDFIQKQLEAEHLKAETLREEAARLVEDSNHRVLDGSINLGNPFSGSQYKHSHFQPKPLDIEKMETILKQADEADRNADRIEQEYRKKTFNLFYEKSNENKGNLQIAEQIEEKNKQIAGYQKEIDLLAKRREFLDKMNYVQESLIIGRQVGALSEQCGHLSEDIEKLKELNRIHTQSSY